MILTSVVVRTSHPTTCSPLFSQNRYKVPATTQADRSVLSGFPTHPRVPRVLPLPDVVLAVTMFARWSATSCACSHRCGGKRVVERRGRRRGGSTTTLRPEADARVGSLLGSPAPIEIGEIRSCLWSQVLGLDHAGELNGHLDLLQVSSTVGTRAQMGLEAASVTTGESAFEIVGDELDRLLAHDVFSANNSIDQPFSIRASRTSRRLDRPR